MVFKSILLLILPAIALAQTCRDNANFSWEYDFQGTSYTHHCSFLTNSVNPQQNEKRQKNWCNQRVGRLDVLIKNKCRKSCDNCDDDNKPGDDCVDKPKNWVDSMGMGCSWYAKGDNVDRCKKFGYR